MLVLCKIIKYNSYTYTASLSPCGKGGQQHSGLRYEECHQQVKGGHPLPLPWGDSSGELSPVLGCPAQDTCIYWSKSSEGPCRSLVDRNIHHVRQRRELALFGLEKTRLWGGLTNSYKHLMKGWG